jgi:cation transport ATPase
MDEVESLTGRGLRAVSNGKTIWIGNQKLMDEAGVTLSAECASKSAIIATTGKTLMWIAEDKTRGGFDCSRRHVAP